MLRKLLTVGIAATCCLVLTPKAVSAQDVGTMAQSYCADCDYQKCSDGKAGHTAPAGGTAYAGPHPGCVSYPECSHPICGSGGSAVDSEEFNKLALEAARGDRASMDRLIREYPELVSRDDAGTLLVRSPCNPDKLLVAIPT